MRTVNRSRGVLLAALVLGLAALGLTGAAFAQSSPWIQGTPRFLAIPGGNPQLAIAESAANVNVTTFTNHFTFNNQTFFYTMIGTDPSLSNATTTIPVVIIPIKFTFAGGLGGSLDATGPACGDTKPVTKRVKKSPVFKKTNLAFPPSNTGALSYIDAFRRANFWNFVSTISPNYHIGLKPTVMGVQNISVPANKGGTSAGPCNTHIGNVDITFFDAIAQNLITNLGIPSTSLPLFLSYNSFWTDGGCCILGYHSATPSNHTYSVAAYSNPGIFTATFIQDIHALSHELGEWLDDPFVNNIVPAWGHIGQVSGCQNNLEVGDPVTGTGFNATRAGKTYHPEDLVFLSWFARETPSKAVNQTYTVMNSIAAVQGVCQ